MTFSFIVIFETKKIQKSLKFKNQKSLNLTSKGDCVGLKQKGLKFSTDREIKALSYSGKNYFVKDNDTKRLFLHIKEYSKLWIYQYTSPTLLKQRRIALGAYPTDTTLKEARERAKELNNKVFAGIDPLEVKQQTKKEAKELKQKEEAEKNYQIHLVIDDWLNNSYSKDVEAITLKKESGRIYNHIIKHFGKFDTAGKLISSKPITKIKDDEVSQLLENINIEKSETAKRLYSHCKGVWEYAKYRKIITNNIFDNISKEYTLKTDRKVKHHPKITNESNLKDLLLTIDNYTNPFIRQPLKFVCYIPLRASNFINLKWEQIDFEKRLLTIPRSQMKVKSDDLPNFHIPLNNQVLEILKESKEIFNNDVWVFPSPKNSSRPISDTTLRNHLVSMGFDDESAGTKTRLHGLRGTFRSLIETYANKHGFRYEAMEAVLDHQSRSKAVKAYIHEANYTEQIGEILEWWSGYLDEVKKLVGVIENE